MSVTEDLQRDNVRIVNDIFTCDDVWGGTSACRHFYIIDAQVFALYAEPLKRCLGQQWYCVLPASEAAKDYEALRGLYSALLDAGMRRCDRLVTVCGGTVQDVAGFVASTVHRGVSWTHVPTTLVSQADSCLGGKTGVNFRGVKNAIGAFYPPGAVVIDPVWLQSLAPREVMSGMGEVIKTHILGGEERLAWLQTALPEAEASTACGWRFIVESSLHIKQGYVAHDERDFSHRRFLNYGHCLGHALESVSEFQIAHGEAVLYGMAFANELSRRRGALSAAVQERILRVLGRYWPQYDLGDFSCDDICRFMQADKKRTQPAYVTVGLCGLGEPCLYTDVTEHEVREALTHVVNLDI